MVTPLARRSLQIAVVTVALVAGRPLAAQPPPNAVIAEQLFRDGERLFKDGKVAEACDKFAASNKLEPAPGTLNNLALCHEKQGKTASAWLELNELAGVAARAGKRDREKAARDHAAHLEATLSRVRVHASDERQIKKLEIDGVPVDVAALAVAFPIDPGEHSVHCVDESGRDAQASVLVPAGAGTTTVEVTFGAESTHAVASVVAPAEPAREPPSTTKRTAGLSLLAVGGAGVVTGGVLGLLANAHRNDKPNDDAFAFASGADVAVVVGLATMAAGAWLCITAPKASPTAGWRVTPVFRQDGAGLQVGGVF